MARDQYGLTLHYDSPGPTDARIATGQLHWTLITLARHYNLQGSVLTK